MSRFSDDFDVSAAADKRRRRRRAGISGELDESRRGCDWAGCPDRGKYRAPKSRDRLDDYYWFCLNHVREYNSRWDYYADMNEDEIARSQRADQTWDRPTWDMGRAPNWSAAFNPHAEGQAWRRFGYNDPLEVLGENATINPGAANGPTEARRRMLPKADEKAIDILGLDSSVTRSDIRRRYKELVKQLHPDMNGGDRSEEDRLKSVLWAWSQLKNSASFRE